MLFSERGGDALIVRHPPAFRTPFSDLMLQQPGMPWPEPGSLAPFPSAHLAEEMKSCGATAMAAGSLQWAFLQPQHLLVSPQPCRCPEPLQQQLRLPAKAQSMGTSLSLANGKLGGRKKHSREGEGNQTAGRHAGGTACLSLPKPLGSSMNLSGTRAAGQSGQMPLLQWQRQQGGLLTAGRGISAELGHILPGRKGGRGCFWPQPSSGKAQPAPSTLQAGSAAPPAPPAWGSSSMLYQ